ncbi:MAG: restriction endonuclease subunit S [Bacteroidia bacterium]|nr:restriction endonuclease subunit S [Bacteroidia bacterium]
MNIEILSDRVEFIYGFSVRIDDEQKGKYPIYGSNGATGFIDSYKVEAPGIIIGRKGTVGAVTFSPDNFTPTDTTYYVELKDKTRDDFKFWYYYLQLLGLDKLNSHSAVPGLSRDLAYLKTIKVPDKKIQEKISNFLSVIDEKIILNNRINTELETMAKTIYNYWFVQFDFPNEESKPYKTNGGEMEFSEELKKEIPKNWQVNKLGDVLKTVLGGTPSTSNKDYWKDGNYNWLNSGEVADFPVVSSELKITEEGIRSSATELLKKGSVLLSITRHLRPTILAIDACANQSVIGIKEKGEIKSYFLYPYLINEIPRLMTLRTGAQQPHINKEIVDDSFIVIPNETSDLLRKYNAKVESIFQQINSSAFQTHELIHLRDFLLPLLMNGQVKVR